MHWAGVNENEDSVPLQIVQRVDAKQIGNDQKSYFKKSTLHKV